LATVSAWRPNTLTSKKFGLSTHWPPSSRARPFTATRRDAMASPARV